MLLRWKRSIQVITSVVKFAGSIDHSIRAAYLMQKLHVGKTFPTYALSGIRLTWWNFGDHATRLFWRLFREGTPKALVAASQGCLACE